MAGRSRPFVIGIVAAAGLGLVALWLRLAAGAPRPPPSGEASGGAAEPAGAALAGPAVALSSPAAPPRPLEGSAARAPARRPSVDAVASARPEDGPEAESWRASRVVFRPRELGRMGASVKVGLDQARREMEFCFRDAARASGGATAPPEDPVAPPPEPAVLLLYLQAREGALDVVDVRVDYLGGATPELVACCREVLRGFEIPAFDAVPERRYRLKFPLE
jgi:hypothetical protein